MNVKFLEESVQNVQKVKTFLFGNPSDNSAKQIIKGLSTDHIGKLKRNKTSMIMSDGKQGLMAYNKNFLVFSCCWYLGSSNTLDSIMDGIQVVRRRKLTEYEKGDEKFPNSNYVWSLTKGNFYGIAIHAEPKRVREETSNLMRKIVKNFANLPEKGMTIKKLDSFIREEVSSFTNDWSKLRVIDRNGWWM